MITNLKSTNKKHVVFVKYTNLLAIMAFVFSALAYLLRAQNLFYDNTRLGSIASSETPLRL